MVYIFFNFIVYEFDDASFRHPSVFLEQSKNNEIRLTEL